MSGVTPMDTTPEARRAQVSALRRMPPSERVRLAVNLCEDMRAIVASGVRSRHPTWTDARVHHEVLRRVYGREFVERVWGAPPVGG